MAKDKKTKQQEALESLPVEVVKNIIEDQKTFIDDVLDYEISKDLESSSYPLKLKEKKKLSKYNIENVDAEEKFDDLLTDLAKMRGVDSDILDEQEYGELSIWVRKICYGAFNLRKVVKK